MRQEASATEINEATNFPNRKVQLGAYSVSSTQKNSRSTQANLILDMSEFKEGKGLRMTLEGWPPKLRSADV